MIGIIYQIICEKSRTHLYIGSTILPIKARLANHISVMKSGKNLPLYNYVRDNNIQMGIQIIQESEFASLQDLRDVEAKWIDIYDKIGCKLFNFYYKSSNWGMRPYKSRPMPMKHTTMKIHPDTWKKMGKALKKKKYTSKNNLINVALSNELKSEE